MPAVDSRPSAQDNPFPHTDSLYDQLFNLGNIIKLMIDPDSLQIVEANPAACQFYGYSLAHLQSICLTDINTQPEHHIRANLQSVVAGTKTIYETRHRIASGDIRDVEVQAAAIKHAGKSYVYAIIQDVTQRKQMEAALRRSERLYRLFAQNMPDSSVVMFDKDMRYTLVEGPFLKRSGPVAESMLGKLPHETNLAPDSLAFIVPIYQRALRGESFSYERQTPNFAYEAHVSPLLDEDGQIIGGVILSHDISEHKRLEDQLRTSQERLRSTLDYAPIGMALFTLEGFWLEVNPAICQIMGYSSEELLQKTFQDITHPDDLKLDLQQIQDLLAAKIDSYRMEKRYFHKQGHVIWGLLSTSLVRDKAGAPICFICQLQDISDRKRLENELRASEERLRLITSNIQDLVIQCDAQDRILYASPSCFQLIGCKPEEMIGHFSHEFFPPDSLDKIVPVLRQMTQQGLTYGIIEARMRHADGHYIDVETAGRFLYDGDGKYSGGIFVTRDISERKLFEAALIEGEEKYRLIAENTSDGIFVFDTVAQRTIYASPTYDRLLGREVGESLDLPMEAFLDIVHPEDRDEIVAQFDKAVTNKANDLTQTFRSLNKDGGYFWREDHTRFNYAADGSLLNTYVVSRDITERKQMESLLVEKQKLETSIEKEHELSHLKTVMMERITHEFRTPLSIIQSTIETLIHYYDRLTPEKREAKNDAIKDQINRIIIMLDEISQVVRNADRPELERQRTDLGMLCRQIAAELATSLNLTGKYIIETQGKLLASIDPNVIHDSLSHLMWNAAHYSEPADPVTVRITQIDDSIEIRIIDRGIGIKPEELPRIFEPFFRGSNINERGGLGVGLTIARASIEAHGGTIRAESELNKGTTFIITLPV